uniref:Uncharacterized protein n=1 Tax=Anopheles dirus TaxID=7168 RepID=A0A182MZ55_9DIPT
MKFVAPLFVVVLLACVAYGVPVGCEDEPEAPPASVDVDVAKVAALAKELADLIDGPQKANVIDGPKVCPDGQKLDHQGKCRPVMG